MAKAISPGEWAQNRSVSGETGRGSQKAIGPLNIFLFDFWCDVSIWRMH